MKFKGKIVLIVSVVVIMLTGLTITTFAANASSSNVKGSGWFSSIWNILTEDQKDQLADQANEKLDQGLADGKISQEQYDIAKGAIESGEMPFVGHFFGKGGRGGRGDKMTEEQKAAMDEMKSKWDALTDEQKEAIYGLNDQKTDIDSKIIDKYLEYGIIEAETAESMKNAFESQKENMRENGRMPMGGRGMRSGKPCKSN